MYDVVIIGAGVSGSACARELSRYNLSICVVEKEEDVCCGTSKANSAIVHSGIDCKPGTLMSEMNVRGNELMEPLSKELDFEFRRNGSLIVCFSEEDRPKLEALYEQGIANKIPDIRILDAHEVHEMEPNLSEEVVAAIYCPTGGIVCPFGLNIALAENAATNGVEFRFNTEVTDICRKDDGYQLSTNRGYILTRCVVNAAGVYADVFHNMVSSKKIHITPRRGEYCLCDKNAGNLVDKTIFQLPTKLGKGILVTPTVHGNLLLGPTAENIEDREDTATTQSGLAFVLEKAGMSVKNVPSRQIITSFSGLRACADRGDFILEESAPNFFEAAGIESPGLTSAPAIGVYMAEMAAKALGLTKKESFNPVRHGVVHLNSLSVEERAEKIRENPLYGSIVCRCETISEGEIVDAIRRPLGAKTLDGVKRRTRAGMGRCQAGFCSPRVMDILARELNLPLTAIRKNEKGSEIVFGKTK